MNTDYIDYILLLLAVTTAVNSLLVIQIVKVINYTGPTFERPWLLPEGASLPTFSGRMINSGNEVTNTSLIGKPGAIIFMASGCDECEKRKSEIFASWQGAKRLGITYLIARASMSDAEWQKPESRKFQGSTMLLDKKSFLELNPQKIFPWYIFFDERGIVQASNAVGDENWSLFMKQVT